MRAAGSRVAFAAIASGLIGACGGTGEATGEVVGDASDPMACAAAISAYTYMVAEGFSAADSEMQSQALVSGMTYLNSYAIPKGLSEPEAFTELETRREELRNTLSTEQIIEQARVCIENTPQV